jgi:hypothetical protein
MTESIYHSLNGLASGEQAVPPGPRQRSAAARKYAMSDTANQPIQVPDSPATIAAILRTVDPMGDLSGFGIADLTADEEAEYFRILSEAWVSR